MHRRSTRYGLILGLTCLLAACGFHLRGSGEGGTALPDAWKSMYLVTGNPNGEFTRDVTTVFAANGVQWQERGSANFSLVLNPERFEQRNLSLNSEARVAEYELTMNAQFSVVDASQQEVMPATVVSVVKQMENDPRNAVGKEAEIRLLQSEMRSELAEQILHRVSFYAASTQAKAAGP
ncbi:MAG: LPS assembly lipoprotein LptE [Halioglobus sp.]